MLNLVKLPELASGLMGGIALGGFSNAISAVSNVSRLSGRRSQKEKDKSGGSLKKI